MRFIYQQPKQDKISESFIPTPSIQQQIDKRLKASAGKTSAELQEEQSQVLKWNGEVMRGKPFESFVVDHAKGEYIKEIFRSVDAKDGDKSSRFIPSEEKARIEKYSKILGDEAYDEYESIGLELKHLRLTTAESARFAWSGEAPSRYYHPHTTLLEAYYFYDAVTDTMRLTNYVTKGEISHQVKSIDKEPLKFEIILHRDQTIDYRTSSPDNKMPKNIKMRGADNIWESTAVALRTIVHRVPRA